MRKEKEVSRMLIALETLNISQEAQNALRWVLSDEVR